MPTERFRRKGAYLRNLAYRHIHGIPYTATTACVGKKCHRVKHSKTKSRLRIDARQKIKDRRLGKDRKKTARKRA